MRNLFVLIVTNLTSLLLCGCATVVPEGATQFENYREFRSEKFFCLSIKEDGYPERFSFSAYDVSDVTPDNIKLCHESLPMWYRRGILIQKALTRPTIEEKSLHLSCGQLFSPFIPPWFFVNYFEIQRVNSGEMHSCFARVENTLKGMIEGATPLKNPGPSLGT